MSAQTIYLQPFHRWAVYHETSETMFSPTFDEEFLADLFAAWYSGPARRVRLLTDGDYSESFQIQLGIDLKLWLDSTAVPSPTGRRLPQEWQERFNSESFEDIALALKIPRLERLARFLLDEFEAWRRERTAAQPALLAATPVAEVRQ
jgi:hypothetical protein